MDCGLPLSRIRKSSFCNPSTTSCARVTCASTRTSETSARKIGSFPTTPASKHAASTVSLTGNKTRSSIQLLHDTALLFLLKNVHHFLHCRGALRSEEHTSELQSRE